MSKTSGEQNRRPGAPPHVSAYEPAHAETVRFSINDRRRSLADRMRVHKIRKDKGRLLAALRAEVARLDTELQTLARPERPDDEPLLVSDHAVIRFLERVMGININAIRDEIAKTVPSTVREDDRIVYIRRGFKFLVFGNRLVSILSEEMDSYIENVFSIEDELEP